MPRPSGAIDPRTAILEAGEKRFSESGFGAVALREIAREAKVNVGSITYHFGNKLGLLEAIYERHTRPMNARRLELIGEATRIEDPAKRLKAILRAYLLPAFTSSDDLAGGGARFTRMRAMLSAEGNPQAREIIARAFDATTRAFIDAIAACLPGARREDIVWRSQFLLGSLYYTLMNPQRIDRLSDGTADGSDQETAIEQIVEASFASLRALARPDAEPAPEPAQSSL
ncbi:TetR/AcrR family transcriptional regulator [Mesorhizobium xinjiangense]|uniref:TetR/AcrR family transcriptional regulator n=1 Tax=Mesorhizobium xinjiangense TaxID=2678685 RepID=UPI0012EE8E3C|nr:TetR/AcrR family transcriptional regulator [Mesorhizobium xinjiangense]